MLCSLSRPTSAQLPMHALSPRAISTGWLAGLRLPARRTLMIALPTEPSFVMRVTGWTTALRRPKLRESSSSRRERRSDVVKTRIDFQGVGLLWLAGLAAFEQSIHQRVAATDRTLALVRCALGPLLVALPTAVRAQSVELDSIQTASVRAALFAVELESPIRIRTVGQSILEGRLAARSDTDIVIRRHGVPNHAAIRRIAEIWRPAPNYRSGAIIGAVTGAVAGSLLGGTLASGLCDRADCHGAFGQGAVAGAGLGGVVGSLIGLGVGALTDHWNRFWPEPSSYQPTDDR